MYCTSLLRRYTAEQPGALAAYAVLVGGSTVCQALIIPTCLARANTPRFLGVLLLSLVVIAGLETGASRVYGFLAPNLEKRLCEDMFKRCLHSWEVGVRDEGQFVCGFCATVNATSTVGNFVVRFALRIALSTAILLGVTATVSVPSAALLVLGLAGLGALSGHLFGRISYFTEQELAVRKHHSKFLSETVANFTHVVVNSGSEERCSEYSSVCSSQEQVYRRTCARMRDYCAALMFGGAALVLLSVVVALWDMRRRKLSGSRLIVLVGAGVYFFQVTVALSQQLAALGYNTGQLRGWATYQENNTAPLSDGPERVPLQLPLDAEVVVEGVRAPRGVLSPLSLVLTTNDRLCVFARSGAGKSSLLKVLAGLEPPAEGRVHRRRRCTFIPQDATVWEGTLWSNLKFGNAVLTRERALDLLTPTGLLEVFPEGLDSPVNYRGQTWSAGQRKLAVVLRALLREQDVGLVLADEPFTSLDATTAQRAAVFFEERTRGRAVLCVTHTAHKLPFQSLYL